ncbi:hypothetical protein AUJ46_00115 [Candidatus Peregrinibacteria bacterium CG1_02_54_53]|nr:MAG: hypothetical protein AUJ46_00115 [Candidatus Peregrinibacteria bacterium CG1_02_54_53]
MKQKERIHAFVEAIWHWYGQHKRSLPWRDLAINDDTERAYRILVSEVMLQQTQVERVIVIYERFLKRFPRLRDLATASNRDVILAWRGMGYNSRALRLRDAARAVLQQHHGIFPCEMNALLAMDGLGFYTAAAIRNFAFNLPTPCIDTNIRRILHRTFVGPEREDGTWEKNDHYLLGIAEEVLDEAIRQYDEFFNNVAAKRGSCGPRGCPPERTVRYGRGAAPLREKRDRERKTVGLSLAPSNWHAALMDFGSLVQTKRSPKWSQCPLTDQNLMKASARNFPQFKSRIPKSEPGRTIAGRFVPNRITRGRIIESLRDATEGLLVASIGRKVCTDWSVTQRRWLMKLLKKLEQEKLVARKGAIYVLHK